MENKKTILLTGATGFLGSHIEQELLKQHKVIRLARGEKASGHVNADIKFKIPILSIPQIDLVVHAAGKAHVVPKTEAEKQEFYDVNLKGTENLLEALKNSNNNPKAFVFYSTLAV